MNNVSLMGRIGQELELKTTTTGKSVLSFPLAVKNFSSDKNNNTDWIDCVAWGKQAEFINSYFAKGNLIAVTGRLSTRWWEDKNGNKHKETEVVVLSTDFTGEKPVADRNTNDVQRGSGTPYEVSADNDLPFDGFAEMHGDTDLPF